MMSRGCCFPALIVAALALLPGMPAAADVVETVTGERLLLRDDGTYVRLPGSPAAPGMPAPMNPPPAAPFPTQPFPPLPAAPPVNAPFSAMPAPARPALQPRYERVAFNDLWRAGTPDRLIEIRGWLSGHSNLDQALLFPTSALSSNYALLRGGFLPADDRDAFSRDCRGVCEVIVQGRLLPPQSGMPVIEGHRLAVLR